MYSTKIVSFGFVLLLYSFSSGCHSNYTRPPIMGPESIGPEANTRLSKTAKNSEYLAVAYASKVAIQNPGNLRALAKAMELLKGGLVHNQQDTPIRREYLKIGPSLAKVTETGRWSCDYRPAFADLFDPKRQAGQAGDFLLRAARQCGSVSAALAAASFLQSTGRCDDSNSALRKLWPRARSQEKVMILDAVAACTDPLFLEKALAFAGTSIVRRYMGAPERKRDGQLGDGKEERLPTHVPMPAISESGAGQDELIAKHEAAAAEARAKQDAWSQAIMDHEQDMRMCFQACDEDHTSGGEGGDTARAAQSRCEERCRQQDMLQRQRIDRLR